ncbi:MAG TPA: MBL fold metallo-hydrolase [Bacillales bacterium]|nr:MBL fold metallo-hydrolase [Bacillales bacterium]
MSSEQLIQLSNNVWIYPFDGGVQPNVGIIVTNTETVLIDCGNSPQSAEEIKSLLLKIDAPPVKYVIYTHHHWDHTFGALAFDSLFISHRKCNDFLKESSKIKWSQEYLEDEIKQQPLLETSNRYKIKLINDWESFRIVLPEITFDHMLEMHLDGVTLELSYIGGNHADDSIVIKVVESNLLFVGDCFYPPPLHVRKETDTHSLEILRKLYDFSADMYIHGHGEPAELGDLKPLIESMEDETNKRSK